MLWIIRNRASPRFALLLAVAGALAQAPERPPAQPTAAAPLGAIGGETAGRLHTTVWRGREISYEVIDGWAVHDGDILLGRLDEIRAAKAGASSLSADRVPGPDLRRGAHPTRYDRLWPDGIIPYEIVEDATEAERFNIASAIEEFNSRTVLRFVPRADQRFYARLDRTGDRKVCSSYLGRGAPANLYAINCSIPVLVHELGHLVGLHHEHARSDRGDYIMFSKNDETPEIDPLSPMEWPYDYRSIMHYDGFQTIPPGILIPSANRQFGNTAAPRERKLGIPPAILSAGDIVGINRLYGQPLVRTLLTTNPPGLDLVVDGVRVTTPATFSWQAGSTHTLEAPLWWSGQTQTTEHRYVFARWSDTWDRIRKFTTRPDQTWVEANYFRQINRPPWTVDNFAPVAFGIHPDRWQYEDLFDGFDVTPSALTFIAEAADDIFETETRLIRLTNRGSRREQYAIQSDSSWLLASPAKADLAVGESVDIEVRALEWGLDPESYVGDLTIRPASLHHSEAGPIRGIPVAFVLLPGAEHVRLGNSGESLPVLRSSTEGLLSADGRPIAKGGRVTASNGDLFALTEGPERILATFVPQTQSLGLADGVEVTLEQHGEGDWRIGTEPISDGHRLVEGGHEYILELVNGRWGLASYTIRTIAGRGSQPIDGRPAVEANLSPTAIAVDGDGIVYFSDYRSHQVFRIDRDGILRAVAGTGVGGYSGDGGPATKARLFEPQGIAVDTRGNLYVADWGNRRLRRIGPDGKIVTLAKVACDRLAVDSEGNVYFAYGSSTTGGIYDATTLRGTRLTRLYKIDRDGIITTVAGTGEQGYGGDGGLATEAKLWRPEGIAVDSAGNVYVADSHNHRVRKIDRDGIITTVAGTGEEGDSGNGGPATEAQISWVKNIAVDPAGNLYLSGAGGGVRKIDRSGTISRFLGLDWGRSRIASDAAGNIYLVGTHTVIKVSKDLECNRSDGGCVEFTKLAGTGRPPWHSFYNASGLEVDTAGVIYATHPARVEKFETDGTIKRVAGTGVHGYSGDGGPATEAQLWGSEGIAVDAAGNVFIAEAGNLSYYERMGNRVRRVDRRTGIITTVAGTGSWGYGGDGGPAVEAQLRSPRGVAVDSAGNVYIADTFNSRLRKVDREGIITTVRGGHFGRGLPLRVAVDTSGRVFVVVLNRQDDASEGLARRYWGRVVMIEGTGLVQTLAWIPLSDGQELRLALAAGRPGEVLFSTSPRLYDGPWARRSEIWKVDVETGVVQVVAGIGHSWFDGGGTDSIGPIASDSSGKIWFSGTGRLRVLEPLPFAPQWQSVELPGGSTIRLTNFEAGRGWRIGDVAVQNGYRYVHGGNEHVLELKDGRWRVSRAIIALGTRGENAELAFAADGTLKHRGLPLANGSTITASNFDTYVLRIGPSGISATLVPQSQTVPLERGGAMRLSQDQKGIWKMGGASVESGQELVRNGWRHRLERSQGRWRAVTLGPEYSIRTVAGTTAVGEGIPATRASLRYPIGIAVDSVGNVFVADTRNHRIRRVDVAGVIRTVAGSGEAGYGGDGSSATAARLLYPLGVAVDTRGNVYVADTANHRVRKIDAAGTITTLAGTGEAGFNGDGGEASEAHLASPEGVAVDAAGNVYVADTENRRVRKIDATGIITTLAGTGRGGGHWDDGPATEASVRPTGVAAGPAGGVYVAGGSRVRKIDAAGIITTVAGGGTGGDGGPAVEAALRAPSGVAVDSAGSVYLADARDSRVRRIDSAGVISTVAGRGGTGGGFGGDGGPATQATLNDPEGVAVSSSGSLYVADTYNHRVRRVDTAGTITTLAGTGNPVGGWAGGPAGQARLLAPASIAVDAAGDVLFADRHRVWKLDASGMVTVVAGTGEPGFRGDGGHAAEARLWGPEAVAVDTSGNVYVADRWNGRVRRIDTAGIITTVAGGGTGGDGGQATEADLGGPRGVAVDSAGNLYLADRDLVRKVDISGIITTVAGGGSGALQGPDGRAAVGSRLYRPTLGAVDTEGNLFIFDWYSRLSKVDAAVGTISTLLLEGDVAITAVTTDLSGNVFLAMGHQIRRMDADGSVWVIAGTGEHGFNGDWSGATDAELSVSGLAVERSGSVWFSDPVNRRIRVLDPVP